MWPVIASMPARSCPTRVVSRGGWSRCVPQAVEAVEDQVEPEFEFGLVVAPAQGGVGVVMGDFGEHCGQVGELAGDIRGGGGGVAWAGSVTGVEQFLGESQRPAAQRVQRVVGQVV